MSRQHPVELQLLVFLQFVGFSGNGGSYRRTSRLAQCSIGSVSNFVMRCTRAVHSLRDEMIALPSTEDIGIAAEFEDAFCFPDCVGVLGGSLMLLSLKPTQYGEDFSAAEACTRWTRCSCARTRGAFGTCTRVGRGVRTTSEFSQIANSIGTSTP